MATSSPAEQLTKAEKKRLFSTTMAAIEQDPTDVRARLQLVDLLQREGRAGDAVDEMMRTAAVYVDRGVPIKAVAVLRQAVKVAPQRADVRVTYGEVFEKLRMVDDAAREYCAGVELFHTAGQHAAEVEALSRLVSLDPGNHGANLMVAEALHRVGRTDLCASMMRSLSEQLLQAGEIDQWELLAERISFLVPTDTTVAHDLALHYVRSDRHAEALGKLIRCYEAEPNDVELLELVIDTLEHLGQPHHAAALLRQLIERYRQGGLKIEAEEALKRLYSLAPDDDEARGSLGVLNGAMAEDSVLELEEDASLPTLDDIDISADDEVGFGGDFIDTLLNSDTSKAPPVLRNVDSDSSPEAAIPVLPQEAMDPPVVEIFTSDDSPPGEGTSNELPASVPSDAAPSLPADAAPPLLADAAPPLPVDAAPPLPIDATPPSTTEDAAEPMDDAVEQKPEREMSAAASLEQVGAPTDVIEQQPSATSAPSTMAEALHATSDVDADVTEAERSEQVTEETASHAQTGGQDADVPPQMPKVSTRGEQQKPLATRSIASRPRLRASIRSSTTMRRVASTDRDGAGHHRHARSSSPPRAASSSSVLKSRDTRTSRSVLQSRSLASNRAPSASTQSVSAVQDAMHTADSAATEMLDIVAPSSTSTGVAAGSAARMPRRAASSASRPSARRPSLSRYKGDQTEPPSLPQASAPANQTVEAVSAAQAKGATRVAEETAGVKQSATADSAETTNLFLHLEDEEHGFSGDPEPTSIDPGVFDVLDRVDAKAAAKQSSGDTNEGARALRAKPSSSSHPVAEGGRSLTSKRRSTKLPRPRLARGRSQTDEGTRKRGIETDLKTLDFFIERGFYESAAALVGELEKRYPRSDELRARRHKIAKMAR